MNVEDMYDAEGPTRAGTEHLAAVLGVGLYDWLEGRSVRWRYAPIALLNYSRSLVLLYWCTDHQDWMLRVKRGGDELRGAYAWHLSAARGSLAEFRGPRVSDEADVLAWADALRRYYVQDDEFNDGTEDLCGGAFEGPPANWQGQRL